MRLGRPKEFGRQETLGKGMQVFWAKGYKAASVHELLEAIDINRGSMYDTFGDKRSLFLGAVGYWD